MSRKKRGHRLGRIERDILEKLSFSDLLYGHLLSGRSSSRAHRLAREHAMDRYRRKLVITRLKELRFIAEHGERLTITDRGHSALGDTIQKTLLLLKTKHWDRKWRLVTFDIPETLTTLRDKVRNILKKAGFVQLHQSVWVFPHECEELVQLIKTESRLSKYILYGVLERIEDEKRLKKSFGL